MSVVSSPSAVSHRHRFVVLPPSPPSASCGPAVASASDADLARARPELGQASSASSAATRCW